MNFVRQMISGVKWAFETPREERAALAALEKQEMEVKRQKIAFGIAQVEREKAQLELKKRKRQDDLEELQHKKAMLAGNKNKKKIKKKKCCSMCAARRDLYGNDAHETFANEQENANEQEKKNVAFDSDVQWGSNDAFDDQWHSPVSSLSDYGLEYERVHEEHEMHRVESVERAVEIGHRTGERRVEAPENGSTVPLSSFFFLTLERTVFQRRILSSSSISSNCSKEAGQRNRKRKKVTNFGLTSRTVQSISASARSSAMCAITRNAPVKKMQEKTPRKMQEKVGAPKPRRKCQSLRCDCSGRRRGSGEVQRSDIDR